MTDKGLIEAAAKAIFAEGDSPLAWGEHSDEIHEYWRRYAHAALEVFQSARQDDWEYRAVASEPDTGDVYDLTGPASSVRWARSDAELQGLLESNAGLPQLVISFQRRHPATAWEPVPDTEGSKTDA